MATARGRGRRSGDVSNDEIVLDLDGAVGTITLNRPREQNRLSRDGIGRLGAVVDRLAADERIRAVIVTGAGNCWFSAGLLDPAIRASLSKDEVIAFVLSANRVFDALEALPQPVICAINGAVMAGAAELALACDIRLAAAHARLAMPEAKWGGFPGAGGPVRLPMVVGHGRALELICTGREIDAKEMARIGLIETVYPGRALRPAARHMAEQIAANGPLATRGAKRIMRLRREAGFRAARDLSDALRRALEWSADVDEGMAAHRAGRMPKFVGK